MKVLLHIFIYFCILFIVIKCENKTAEDDNLISVGRSIMGEARTFIQRHLRRFMALAPAIFFKLGIAFTLLVLVTLVATTNGFIGFLILVVGLSSVLSRFQVGAPAPVVQPLPVAAHYAAAFPHVGHYHHPLHHASYWADRSDTVPANSNSLKKVGFDGNVDYRTTGAYFNKNYLGSNTDSQNYRTLES